MSVIRVTKEFSFELAHALWNYDGKCKNLHGHSYRLRITLKGKPESGLKHPRNGMVIDFNEIRQIIQETIIDRFDHAVVLNRQAPVKELCRLKEMFGNTEFVPFQPTCENMVIYFVKLLRKKIPLHVSLCSVRLYETLSSFAEWREEDN